MIALFRGMPPAAAELMYIKLAQQLPEYGHEIYQALVGAWPSFHLSCHDIMLPYRIFMEVVSGWVLVSLGYLWNTQMDSQTFISSE